MKFILLIYLCLCAQLLCAQTGTSGVVSEIAAWLSLPVAERGDVSAQKFSKKSLTKAESAEISGLLLAGKAKQIEVLYDSSWNAKSFCIGDKVMKFDYQVFGDKPADGRSLWISMHGGGNTAKEVNDQQWQNQIRLYRPAEGVYIAPRAPENTWDLWHRPYIDTLFDRLIQTAVVKMGVNPDKVYVMGYSAGGDGTFRLAPRMADHWAAASMMAGHPGDVSPLNLRNIGFMIWMGENDAAYDRNRLASEWGGKLDSLRQADTAGYVHEVHIVTGKGHWMDREDARALPWMARFQRNTLPEKIVWRQEEVPHTSFYWLSVPVGQARKGTLVVAERSGNRITILENGYQDGLTIGLNDDMIDFNRPVEVFSQGKRLFKGKVSRTVSGLYRSVEARNDRGLVFGAYIRLDKDGARVL